MKSNNISLLVGLKNNLDYTINFYLTTRELYPDVEIVFVSYGSTDGTNEWLDMMKDKNTIKFYSEENKTFSDTFNKASELSTKEYNVFLHNDVVIAPEFLENICKHLNEKTIVSYTTIEPPIFAGHERPGKLINDLGDDLNNFKSNEFKHFVLNYQQSYKDKIGAGITFFMAFNRANYLDIGGMDNLFNPMFCEDDDLIRRWKLLGKEMLTSLDAICYHFVSKTSRFSEEYKNRSNEIEFNSNRNYFRKWGTKNMEIGKYDIGFIVTNTQENIIRTLEPFCSTIYVDCDYKSYIENEQPKTKYNLWDRIKMIEDYQHNDITLKFDGNLLDQNNFNILQQLPEILKNTPEPGKYVVGIFEIEILNLNPLYKELINV